MHFSIFFGNELLKSLVVFGFAAAGGFISLYTLVANFRLGINPDHCTAKLMYPVSLPRVTQRSHYYATVFPLLGFKFSHRFINQHTEAKFPPPLGADSPQHFPFNRQSAPASFFSQQVSYRNKQVVMVLAKHVADSVFARPVGACETDNFEFIHAYLM